jgi:hypothetical protein
MLASPPLLAIAWSPEASEAWAASGMPSGPTRDETPSGSAVNHNYEN